MATLSWIGTTGGDWSTGANWQGGIVPGSADDAVMNLTAAETITVSTPQHVQAIEMTDTAAAFVVTGSGTLDATGAVALNIGSAVLGGEISSDVAITVTAQGPISVSGALNARFVYLQAGSLESGGVINVGTATAVIPDSAEPLTGLTLTDNGSGGVSVAVTVSCFAEGTQIATPDGETPVEQLAVGDLVGLVNNATAPITWLGHRRIDCCRHPHPDRVRPVRIRQGAFADNVPHRDLILSPDHAIYWEGALIPVRFLCNGRSIVQENWDCVTYFHVQLPRHQVLLAQGLPVESYLETTCRDAFANSGAVTRLVPEFTVADPQFVVRQWEAKGFAPLVVTGPILERCRNALRRRALRSRRSVAAAA